ncbi:hypothetical protein SynSYN20_00773 [Synechococcus sp. SYN20]|uniref:hypothetical protein n=1 Tax=Synechococcus sp. SYN20 TaxID=1050714 RepID=UPI001860790B|nr:hypothetical protein [Synechococcus sp. SYN20]QNJ25115.1 hypothetical protein SynSYN20_00773 [Synechococcus sp. SYN20]
MLLPRASLCDVHGEHFIQLRVDPVSLVTAFRLPAQAGFVLPLALSASAVLLLGSLSIYTLSLQGRLRLTVLRRRELVADQLRSAAQAFATAARGPESCLLPWPFTDWSAVVQSCEGADPFALSHGVVGEIPWSLLDWQPSTGIGQLTLQLEDGRTGSFRVGLDPIAPAVLGIGDVQLQGRVSQLRGE